jgi:hypothetical protein
VAVIFHWSLRTLFAGADRAGNLGHNEVHGLVNHLEDRALEDLVGRDRLSDLYAVIMQAFNLGCWQEALRVIAKKKNRGMRGVLAIQQV